MYAYGRDRAENYNSQDAVDTGRPNRHLPRCGHPRPGGSSRRCPRLTVKTRKARCSAAAAGVISAPATSSLVCERQAKLKKKVSIKAADCSAAPNRNSFHLTQTKRAPI